MKTRGHVEEEGAGELNVVPYLDIVVNLVMFMLLSTAGVLTLGILDVGTPRLGDPGAEAATPTPEEEKGPELMLTVAIAKNGFFVAGAGGVLPGEAQTTDAGVDTSAPPTVPMKDGKQDFATLTQFMKIIKEKYPKDGRVILVAENDTPYEWVIQTMDATREYSVKVDETTWERKQLFPEVWLSMLR